MELELWWQELPSWGQIALSIGLWLGGWLPLATLTALGLGWRPFQPLLSTSKLPLLVSLYALVPVLVWGITRLEKRPLTAWGWRFNWGFGGAVALGFCLAVSGLAVVFALESRQGWLQWQRERWRTFIGLGLPILALALWISCTEEMLFRGVFLTLAQADSALGIAAVSTSGLFAASHLLWEQKQTVGQLAGLWLMGMVLVLARLVAGGDLALAIGLHAGWIWGLTCLAESQVMVYRDRAPVWWVGLHQQPLAGAAGIFCLWGTAAGLGAIAPVMARLYSP